jgi:hypothetical protein
MAARPSGSRPMVWRSAVSFNRAPTALAAVRLAQVYQVAHGKNAMELYRRSCQRVAQGNEVLRAFGLTTLVVECMAPIDASLASDEVPPLLEALHEAEMTDCLEQPTDETLREKLRLGKATVADAQDYIRKSAAARHRAEIAERAVRAWIQEQEAVR